MFNQERHAQIMSIIEKNKRVEVNSLSKQFDVSVDTIRRDLRQMEKDGLIIRTHGGALLPEKTGVSVGYDARKRIHIKEKSKIAKLAVTYLKDQDTVLMDGSTTTAAMIPYMGHLKNLTVFTNSITVAHEILNSQQQIKVYMIGGILHPHHESTLSIDCLTYLNKLRVDKVFVGSCSLSPTRGLSATDIEDASIKKAMLDAGNQVIILSDITKFTKESLVQIAPIDPKYTLITNEDLTPELKFSFKDLIANGLKIKVAN